MISPVLVMGSGPWLTAWLRHVLTEAGVVVVDVLEPTDLRPGMKYSAAVIDLNLPDLMGWTLLETVASEVPTAVILGADPGEANTALDLGARAFIERPIDPEGLLAVLRFLERPADGRSASLVDDLTGLPSDAVEA